MPSPAATVEETPGESDIRRGVCITPCLTTTAPPRALEETPVLKEALEETPGEQARARVGCSGAPCPPHRLNNHRLNNHHLSLSHSGGAGGRGGALAGQSGGDGRSGGDGQRDAR